MAKFTRSIEPTRSDEPIGRVKVYDRIYLGFVKENTDVQKMGRLKVWIPELGSEPNERESWVTVSYASPFAGATDPTRVGNNQRLDSDTQTSYGWWGVPPDLENQVLVFFINGDPARGVWFGSLYQQNMNQMVPGVAARAENYKDNGRPLPVTEYNRRTSESPRDGIRRPESTIQSRGISSQGLINDTIRGITDTSARRESPSEVYGFLTPGPKRPGKEGKRTGGTSFYMDDGEGREHVRIRTKTGAQLLLDETNGIVYAINKLGTSWIQMDAEGNVDIFGAKSFSVRSQEDVNIRADRDLNIEAGRNLNIKAAKDYTGQAGNFAAPSAGSGGNINLHAMGDTNFYGEGRIQVTTTGDISFGTDGRLILNSSLATMIKANASVNIRAGNAINADAPSIDMNMGAAQDINAPTATTPTMNTKTTVLETFSDPDLYNRQTNGVQTISTRLPTYEPCPEHKVR